MAEGRRIVGAGLEFHRPRWMFWTRVQRPRYYYTTDWVDRTYITRQAWVDLLDRCQFDTAEAKELSQRVGFVVG